MKNEILIIIMVSVILAGIVGWYLVFPAFSVIEADEKSPFVIRDSMLEMSDSEKEEFENAVDEIKDKVIETNDETNLGSRIVAEGKFMERAHGVSGKALLIDINGKKALRFEDFETINGPNLHIYLSSSLGGDDFIDLGKIKATKGNVNYEFQIM